MQLRCDALGEAPLSYKWTKNDLAVNAFSEFGWQLYLINISSDDAGEYRCLAKNRIGIVMSKSAIVRVICEYV